MLAAAEFVRFHEDGVGFVDRARPGRSLSEHLAGAEQQTVVALARNGQCAPEVIEASMLALANKVPPVIQHIELLCPEGVPAAVGVARNTEVRAILLGDEVRFDVLYRRVAV